MYKILTRQSKTNEAAPLKKEPSLNDKSRRERYGTCERWTLSIRCVPHEPTRHESRAAEAKPKPKKRATGQGSARGSLSLVYLDIP